MHVHSVSAALAMLLASALVPTFADVNVEADGNAVIKGRIFPQDDRERFEIEVTRGAALTIDAIAKGASEIADFGIRVDGHDTADAGKLVVKGGRFTVKNLPMLATDTVGIDLTSFTGVGEYQLKLKLVPQRRFGETVDLVSDSGEHLVAFAAPAGSTLTIKAKAARKSPARPRLTTLGGVDLSTLGKQSKKSHTVKLTDFVGGDASVGVLNVAGERGGVSVTITVKAPKSTKTKLDFRDDAFSSQESDTVVGRTVATGGDALHIDDAEDPLDGAGVDVPPGALAAPARLFVGSAAPVDVPDPEVTQALGRPVELGPAGQTFDAPVTVSLPFDATALPIGRDADDLQVLRVSADGSTALLTPANVEIHGSTGRIDVLTDRFSTFVAVVPRGPPNLAGREYWSMFVEAEIGNIGERRLFAGVATTRFGPDGRLDVELVEHVTTLSQRREVGPDRRERIVSTQTTETIEEEFETEWDYAPDGQSIFIVDEEDGGSREKRAVTAEDDAYELALGRDGAVLVGSVDAEPEQFATLDVLIEKLDIRPTVQSLAGTFWMGELEVAFRQPPPDGIAGNLLFRSFGTLELRADGTWSADVQGRETETGATLPPRVESGRERFGGDWQIDTVGVPGTIAATFVDDGDEGTLRLYPGASGEVLLGMESPPLAHTAFAVVAVRQSKGLARGDLVGTYGAFALEVGPRLYSITGLRENVDDEQSPLFDLNIPDIGLTLVADVLTFDGGKTFALQGLIDRAITGRDDPTGPLPHVDITDADPESFPSGVSVTRTGQLTVTGDEGDRFLGAVTPSGSFFFLVDDPRANTSLVGFEVGVRLPSAVVLDPD